MKLYYKREYTSCTNYKAEVYNGFRLETFVEGADFSSSSVAVKTNFLIFILEGEIRITKDHGEASKRCRRRVHIVEPSSIVYTAITVFMIKNL